MTWQTLFPKIRLAGSWLLSVSAIFYVFSLFFPWISGPPISIDASWEMALHAAWQQHLQFGRDIIFTLGPWGFLFGGYAPQTFPLSAFLWEMLAGVFWWAGWRVAGHFSSHKLVSWLWFMGFAGVAGIRIEQSFDVRMTGWVLLLLFLHFFVEKSPLSARQIVMVIASGMLALVKFTGFIEISVVVAVIAADNLVRQRRFPWIVPLFAGSVLLFWILAGQNVSLLWPFLHYSWLLTSGYTQAMMWTAPGEGANAAGMVLAMAVLLALTGYTAWTQRRRFGLLPLAGLGAILFLIFKHGHVRYDSVHEITTALELLLVALACLAVTWPALRKEKWRVGYVSLACLAGVYLFCSSAFHQAYTEEHLADEHLWVDFAWTLNRENLTAPLKLLRDPAHLQNVHAEYLAEIRRLHPLPSLKGSVDVYPWRQAVLLAHGFQYDPRPVIQSYSAYTPELLKLNALHLQGGHAPDNILFDIDPQNGNYPSLEDGLSWPELLTRYDLTGTADGFVILKHAPQPRAYHLTLMTNALVRLGGSLTIATHQGPVWATVEIRPTLWGKVVSTFYKPKLLVLVVSLNDGERLYFNLVPGMARAGFLLSPLISQTDSFASLASDGGGHELAGLQVTSATILPATQTGSLPDYQSPVRWRLYHLDFPLQKIAPKAPAR